jgi:DnaJ-class molecular chaperone
MNQVTTNPCPACNGWGEVVKERKVNGGYTVVGVHCGKCWGTGKRASTKELWSLVNKVEDHASKV